MPPFIQAMQHPVKGNSYDFLSHDSYIDCSSIKTMRKNKLLKCRKLGALEEDDIKAVSCKIRNNSRISTAELKRFGLIE